MSQFRQNLVANFNRRWAVESTQTWMHRFYVATMIVVLGLIGPLFVALPIFLDRPTSVRSVNCAYDAALINPPGRFAAPERPRPYIVDSLNNVYNISVLNSGTCDWNSDVTLRLESGQLSDAPAAFSITPVSVPPSNVPLVLQIPFSATLPAHTVVRSTWRLYTPDGRSFGAPLHVAIITHPVDSEPIYPTAPLIDVGSLIRFVAFLLPAVIGFVLAMQRSGKFVMNFYSLTTEARGVDHLLRLVFHWGDALSAIAKGKSYEGTRENEALDKIGGPSSVFIHADTAVLTERGGGFSRIAGPGDLDLLAFERVKAVIDLRTLSRTAHASARTQDGIQVQADVAASCRLMKKLDNENIPAYGDPPASPEVLRSIVYDAPSPQAWESAAAGAVAGAVSGIISKKKLDELWAPDDAESTPRRDIFNDVLKATKDGLRKRGIELIDISIGAWEVDPRIVRQRRELWRYQWETEAHVIEAEGIAEANYLADQARAQAKAELIQSITRGLRMIQGNVSEKTSHTLVQRVLWQITNSISLALSEPVTSSYSSHKLPRWDDSEGETQDREVILRAIEHANKTQRWDQLPKLIERLTKPR